MTNYFNFVKDLNDEQVELALEALRQESDSRKAAKPQHAATNTAKEAPASTTIGNDGKAEGHKADPRADKAESPKDDEFETQIRNVFVAAFRQVAMAKKVAIKGNIDAKKVANHWDRGSSKKIQVGFDINIEIG